jgi:HEAT repeat protein
MTASEQPPPDEIEFSQSKGAMSVVIQFFLVPLLVVAVCVGLFLLFSLLTFEHKSPSDYLQEVRGGSANRRWQAAFELSKTIGSVPPGPERERLADESLEIYAHLHPDRPEDVEVKRYLTLVLGKLRNSRALPALTAATRDSDPETRLYAVWSLGMLGNAAAAPAVVASSESDDPGMRKMAAYVLGKLGSPEGTRRLQVLLDDTEADVRWNAAISLAELGDAAGSEVLHAMIDRASLGRQAPRLSALQTEEAMVNALRAEALLRDRAAADQIRKLSESDPDLKVRDQARKTLAEIESGPPSAK